MKAVRPAGRGGWATLTLLAAAALLVRLPAPAGEVRDARPNLVLIVADDHGTDALGCYGNPEIRTPHLDALAADGTRFTHAFGTTASCSPSRSVILTGQHNHRNGMYGLQHDMHHFQSFATVKSLPVRLAAAGYRTARIGKFHVAPESVYAFETVLSGGAANDPASLGRSPVEMAEQVRDVVFSRDARPFFLYFATDDPHRGNVVLPNGRPSFETYPAPNPFGNRAAGYPGVTPVKYDPARVRVPPFLPDTPECRAELAEYYQAVSRLDQGVGRLVQLLKDSGQYERTLIVYLSDNGVAFPGAKTTLYDPGVRLPLLVRMPGRRNPGVVQDAMVSWVDLTPTLLEVAGAPIPEGECDGRSFRAALDGASLPGWDVVYGSHTSHEITMYYPMRSVRTRQYKLIHNLAHGLRFPFALDLIQSPTWVGLQRSGATVYGQRPIAQFLQRPEFELYDLTRDPGEVVNLADAPDRQGVKRDLVEKLKAFQVASRDPWMHKWSYE
ncbi:MAG: sulfatase [Verrucomicrobia bacterium]|nr:sulfatase [Verrucomicrobiota bacterium]